MNDHFRGVQVMAAFISRRRVLQLSALGAFGASVGGVALMVKKVRDAAGRMSSV